MLYHFIKIAFRNMWKYRSQTAISIVGLAVGFTCFALSALWIRYEMTYDNFIPDAERVYVLQNKEGGRSITNLMAAYLNERYPDIEKAVTVRKAGGMITVDDTESRAKVLCVDSGFLELFGVKILAGTMDFLVPESKVFAITDRMAKQLFGDENPLGKEIKYRGATRTVCAVVNSLPLRSNYRFDLLTTFAERNDWNSSNNSNTLIKLYKGCPPDTLLKKFEGHRVAGYSMTPITKMHYTDVPTNIFHGDGIRFHHIVIFSVSGLLVIACTLFNYLSLFVARFRIRRRELALRIVHGASGWSLLFLLATEFLLSLIIAWGLAFMLIESVFKEFLRLSDIQMSLSDIAIEAGGYTVVISLFLMLILALVTYILRKRSLNVSIRKGRSNRFRQISIIIQLIISIGFTFCTAVLIMQLYFLHNTTELGFSFKNRAEVRFPLHGTDRNVMLDKLREIPEIEEVIEGYAILPITGVATYGYDVWEDKVDSTKGIGLVCEEYSDFEKYYNFYEMKLLKGETLAQDDSVGILLNETAARLIGWDNPVGKWMGYSYLSSGYYKQIVRGVVKDICTFAPTIPIRPTMYRNPDESDAERFDGNNRSICALIKYREGTIKTVRSKIETMLENSLKDVSAQEISITVTSDVYDEYLVAEKSLLTLLSFTSATCVLICIFGFVSLISLSCEERRKEIAIRKINGATVLDIINIFFKENFLLLIIGALVAFPIGYYIMRQWLEQYVRQTPIGAWVYLTIIAAMAAVIVMCVGWRVWRASVENPAEVIKINN